MIGALRKALDAFRDWVGFTADRFSTRAVRAIVAAMPKTDMTPERGKTAETVSYTVKENARAKHVSLRLSADEGLVVVVPRGFNRKRIPAIVGRKIGWVRRAAERLRAEQVLQPGHRATMPAQIVLPALGRELTVVYRKTGSKRVSARDRAGDCLVVSGPVDQVTEVQAAIKRGLMRRAKTELAPWVWELAGRHRFTISRVGVRSQRTRWASCSRRGTITLNAKLLFLAPELVRHVILHELCHTVYLNHSRAFWRLLERYDAGYREHNRRLRSAGRQVPAWFG